MDLEISQNDIQDNGRNLSTIPMSSRRDSLNEAFDDLTLSGAMTNSILSENGNNNFQPMRKSLDIKIPIARKLGCVDTTKPVINNPYLDSFLSFGNYDNLRNNQQNIFGGFSKRSPEFTYMDHTTRESSNDKTASQENNLIENGHSSSNFFRNAFASLFNLTGLQYASDNRQRFVGRLTAAERQEKVRKFLEKKKNRKFKSIRYSVRKNLAEKRQRIQGRFVKSKSPLIYLPDLQSGEKSNNSSDEKIRHNSFSQ